MCPLIKNSPIPLTQRYIGIIEDAFHPYVSHGDPYAKKPTFCNAQACGGCSDQPFENINNCIRWCRAPCMCISPAGGRGDDIMCFKSRH